MYNKNDYGSEFEYDSEAERNREKRHDLADPPSKKKSKRAHQSELEEERTKQEFKVQKFKFLSLDAYGRHKQLVNNYLQYYGGSIKDFKRDCSKDRTDLDVIRENHRFLWNDEDTFDNWEKKLAKSYYDKLFKEYTICDLSRYKDNKVALRWRVSKEVVDGKGQFICGCKGCDTKDHLRTWEVNFGYVEHGNKRNALVKLRLCVYHSDQLNYRHKKKEFKRRKKEKAAKSNSDAEPEADDVKTDKSDDKSSDVHQEASNSELSSNSDSIWSGPQKIPDIKTKEDEFEEYLEDMFL